MTQLFPLHDRVLVEPKEPDSKTDSGLFLPDTTKEAQIEGVVQAVGKGRTDEDGVNHPLAVKVGDRILFNRYGGVPVRLDNTDYLVMREDDILGVIEEDKKGKKKK